jgi:hypothetical protein
MKKPAGNHKGSASNKKGFEGKPKSTLRPDNKSRKTRSYDDDDDDDFEDEDGGYVENLSGFDDDDDDDDDY